MIDKSPRPAMEQPASAAMKRSAEHSDDPFQSDKTRRRHKGGFKGFLRGMGDNLLAIFSISFVIAILFVLYLWNGIIVLIKAGEAGVLYKPLTEGTVVDYVYPEGLHLLKPWNRMFIYNTRIQTVLHKFDVLTNKGLPISLTLAVRYHPEREMVGILHQRVGPDYVETIVIPQIESVLRRNIGRHDPEDIYTNKEGILTDIIVKAIEEAGQKFVYIDDIIIRTISLPPEIQEAIREKLIHQQRWYAYEYILEATRQEAERKRIEAQGVRDYQATINETLSDQLILWEGIGATRDLAQSPNSKLVVIGSGDKGLPVILGADTFRKEAAGSLPENDGTLSKPESGQQAPTASIGAVPLASMPKGLEAGESPASPASRADISAPPVSQTDAMPQKLPALKPEPEWRSAEQNRSVRQEAQ